MLTKVRKRWEFRHKPLCPIFLTVWSAGCISNLLFTGKFKVDNFVTVAALAKGHEVPYPVPDIDIGFRQSGVNHAARTHWTDGRIFTRFHHRWYCQTTPPF